MDVNICLIKASRSAINRELAKEIAFYPQKEFCVLKMALKAKVEWLASFA